MTLLLRCRGCRRHAEKVHATGRQLEAHIRSAGVLGSAECRFPRPRTPIVRMSWLRGAAQGGPGEPSGSGGLTRATEQRPDERDRELGRRADALTLNVFAGLAGVPLVLGLFGAERFLADRVTVRCLPP